MRIHTVGDKRFKCTICNKLFPYNLIRHMRTHSGEKPFKCKICSQEFSQNSSCIRHMRKHTGERPYKCSVCKKEFIDGSYFKRHLMIHTEERPHECNICDKGFIELTSMKSHQKTHLRMNDNKEKDDRNKGEKNFSVKLTAKKPFQCKICQKVFSYHKIMLIHKKRHNKTKELNISNFQKDDEIHSSETSTIVSNCDYQSEKQFNTAEMNDVIKSNDQETEHEKNQDLPIVYNVGDYSPLFREYDEEKKNLKCYGCKVLFSSELDIEDHKIKHSVQVNRPGRPSFTINKCKYFTVPL